MAADSGEDIPEIFEGINVVTCEICLESLLYSLLGMETCGIQPPPHAGEDGSSSKAVKTRGLLNGESENKGRIGQGQEADEVNKWADPLKQRVEQRKEKSLLKASKWVFEAFYENGIFSPRAVNQAVGWIS